MEKREYETPKIEIVKVEMEDVITTSGSVETPIMPAS